MSSSTPPTGPPRRSQTTSGLPFPIQSPEVRLLDCIFRLRAAVQYRSGRSKKGVHVRQSFGFEPGDTSESGTHRARFAGAIAGFSFLRHISIPSQLARRYDGIAVEKMHNFPTGNPFTIPGSDGLR